MAYKMLFYRYCAISYLKLNLIGLLLFVFAGTVGAEIAATPLSAYSTGGRNILVIFGNSSTMGGAINPDGDMTIKSDAVARAIAKMIKPLTAGELLTETNTASVTAVLNGRRVGLGLMTFGGTSATSPYLWSATTPYSWPPDPPAFPYSTYKNELSVTAVVGTVNFPDCNDDPNGLSSGSFATLFYRNPASNSHPYCLPKPVSIVCVAPPDDPHATPPENDPNCPTGIFGDVTVGVPRPTGYLAQGGATCSTTPPELGLYTLCYGSPPTASTPAMGKLRIPVQPIPPSPNAVETNSATLATAFSTAVSNAGNAGGRAIEGALLTACDYFNTSWLDGHSPPRNMSLCYRGYRPGPIDILPPNKLTDIGQIDTTRISSIADLPNMPSACQSAVILIADGSQTTTADGQFYNPSWVTRENPNLGRIIPPAQPSDDPPPNILVYSGEHVDPLSGLTDPVLLALDNLKAMNKQGEDKISAFYVGLGAPWDPATDVLNQKGLNSRYGSMIYAWDQAALKEALDNAVSNVLYTPGIDPGWATASSVAASSSVLSNNVLIFQAAFKFNNGWKGDLEASSIDVAHPTAAGTVKWNAASKPFDAATRAIFTYIPGTGGTSFNWDGLSQSQRDILTSNNEELPSLLVDWLRGDVSYDNNDQYRNRGGEGNLLGDIINSDPVYVGFDNYAYDSLPGTEGASYASFLATKTSRQPVVYVGANDGMLHGFSVGSSTYSLDPGAYGDGGGEVLAYVPNAVIGLSSLTSPLVKYAKPTPGAAYYPHIYTVDGSPSVSDAYISSAWKTVLVGSTGAGAKSIFALDITTPLSFANANVLWEISDTDDATNGACTPVCRNITTGTSTSIHGDLGYTFAQPTIVRLNNGHWGAVVGNGYNSARGHAVLFIFDIADGSLIKKIDTGADGNRVIAKNGLSTPIAVDVNGDRIADTVYAGDLTGNLWKFDISNSDPANWRSAYSTTNGGTTVPKPLFVACRGDCEHDSDRQPITGKPNIGSASGTGQGSGLMVYFGTGKYFELVDNIVDLAVATPPTQSFYALWDNGSRITGHRSDELQAQTIATETTTYRTTSRNTVDYADKQGWYMDLLSPSAPRQQGERIVSFPVVRNGRIIFVTMTPNNVTSCKAGGFSWVMELDAVSGKPLASSPRDTNRDGTIDSSDLIDGTVPSGIKSSIGIVKAPTILAPNTNCTTEIKVFGGTGDTPGIKEKVLESCSPGTTASGRSSWRQL